jgi:hypothetical protein
VADVGLFRNRSVVEIIVLSFTFAAVAGLPCLTGLVIAIEWHDPTADTSDLQVSLGAIMTLMVGSLFGLIGAKGSAGTMLEMPPNQPQLPPGSDSTAPRRRPDPGNVVPTWPTGQRPQHLPPPSPAYDQEAEEPEP